jgi:uncharacterized protein GlcG (DUF336 family)
MITSQALNAVIEGQERARSEMVFCCITVVDSSGTVLVMMRDEKAGFLTSQTSQAKAIAAAAFKKTGKEMIASAQTNPHFWATVPTIIDRKILPTMGSAPILLKGTYMGAVGVGGGTPEQDQQLAQFVASMIAQTSIE